MDEKEIKKYMRLAVNEAKKAEKALVVGAGELGQQTVKMLQSGVNYDVSFIVDTEDEHVGLLLDGIPVYGIETLGNLLCKNEIKCVFLAEPDLNKGLRAKIGACCKTNNAELKEYMLNGVNSEVTEMQFQSVTTVDQEWAEEYRKQFGEEPSFF